MKKKFLYGVGAILAIAGSGMQADLLSGSEELKLDFKDAVKSIRKMAQSAEPMNKALEKNLPELQKLMAAVKKNPNVLNKSKFELAFAKNISSMD